MHSSEKLAYYKTITKIAQSQTFLPDWNHSKFEKFRNGLTQNIGRSMLVEANIPMSSNFTPLHAAKCQIHQRCAPTTEMLKKCSQMSDSPKMCTYYRVAEIFFHLPDIVSDKQVSFASPTKLLSDPVLNRF